MSNTVTEQRSKRWRSAVWVGSALAVIVAVAALTTYLSAPRDGGRLDPASTFKDGVHALVTLLRDHGVEVIVADSVDDVEKAARPDTLVVVAQTLYLDDDDRLKRLAAVPGDRLVVEPATRARAVLVPKVRRSGTTDGGAPDCELPEANRAGVVDFGTSDTYEATDGTVLQRCYHGAVARYSDAGRTVTVVGSGDFMMNGGLLRQGNAALAMNLAGTQRRVIWYAPQHSEGESSSTATLSDLIPKQVRWVVLQLWIAVLLVAVWRGRRIGPLVAEQLPVVVRASETVEGRGRLYRSRRARDRAAEALRAATLHRMLPRLGLTSGTSPAAVVQAVMQRCGGNPDAVAHTLFGPSPGSDDDLVNLAVQLDDIERQVAQS